MDRERLIEVVKNYSFLYDQQEKWYSNNYKKEEAWKEIGKSLNTSPKECKKQWHLLRDSFRRSLKKRKEAKGAQAASAMKKWKYENEMSFIIPFIKEREPISFVDVEEGLGVDPDDEWNIQDPPEPMESELSNGQYSPPSRPVTRTTSKKTSNKNKSSAAPTVLMDYILKNKPSPLEDSEIACVSDEVDAFFKSIALTVNKLSPYNQAMAKAKVFSVVSQLELNELENNKTV